jgi:hypothetical protein
MAKRLVRLGPAVYGPTGIVPLGKTQFRELFINTGRLRLVEIGERARALVQEELDEVVEELIAARDARPPKLSPPVKRSR